jgi:2-C-methyl-D-erythritol 4-phosphate cytidylyltransferase
VVEANGGKIALFAGAPENIKITNPLDFKIAEAILSAKA